MPFPQGQAFGFIHVGGEYKASLVPLLATNTAMGIGDPVTAAADGTVNRAAAGDVQIRGVIQESPAASAGGDVVIVENVPGSVWATRLGGTPAVTAIGASTDILVANADNSQSRCELATGISTGDANFKILERLRYPGNDWGDANVIVKGFFFETFHGVEDPGGV